MVDKKLYKWAGVHVDSTTLAVMRRLVRTDKPGRAMFAGYERDLVDRATRMRGYLEATPLGRQALDLIVAAAKS